MFKALGPSRLGPAAHWLVAALLCALFALPISIRAQGQQQPPAQQPASATPTPDPAATAPASAPDPAQAQAPAPEVAQTPAAIAPAALPAQSTAVTEEQLKQMLLGRQFYLRGGFLGDNLNFDEHGHIIGHSAQGSYTLSIVQIDRVRLTKHKLELEGTRYGLHFNEQLAYEDSSTAFDKVRITPKKKVVKITIDREMVVNPKKKKESAKEKSKAAKPVVPSTPGTAPAAATLVAATAPASAAPASATNGAAPDQTASAAPAAGPKAEPDEPSEAEQLKASIAATPEAERPADPSSVTTTTSQAHANELLHKALDAALAPGLDERMMAAMPDFWKLYYQAVAAKVDYRPVDPTILRQNTVDEKAHLLTSFEPDSNDFAQAAGVAGMALYHTVIGADGKPSEIAVARPIGFGLDENAVASIRKAKFSPAIKDGKPVPVMLDLVVQFRIFSNRTAAKSSPETADKDKTAGPMLPGPYSVPHPTNPPQSSNN
jgi:Gram-negative bacterial TonB protein C-terminal